MSQGVAQIMMDDPGLLRPDVHESGPPLGFSIGVAALLVIVFSSSVSIVCCYCRDRPRSPSQSSPDPDIEQPPLKPDSTGKDLNSGHGESLPVIMPGDRVPTFVALPCPREPPRAETKVVEMQKAAATSVP